VGSGAATGVLIRRLTIALVANELQWMKYTLLQTLHQHIKLLKCDGCGNGESFTIRLNLAIMSLIISANLKIVFYSNIPLQYSGNGTR